MGDTNIEEEFREFVAARSAALLRTAYLLTGDWGTGEDLLQTALTKTYLAWKRLGEIGAVEAYTRRVMVNTATSWWRRRWWGERPTEQLPEQAGPDQHQQTLERDAMWQQLRALPPRQRAVLVLRYYEDLSEAQIAELLDISPGTVKSQAARALATLRARLGADRRRSAVTPTSSTNRRGQAGTVPDPAKTPQATPAMDSTQAGQSARSTPLPVVPSPRTSGTESSSASSASAPPVALPTPVAGGRNGR